MSTLEVSQKASELFKEIEDTANSQKTNSKFIKLEDGKSVTLKFLWLSGKEEDLPHLREEIYEPKNEDGTPKLGEDGKPISRKTKKVYCNVIDVNNPTVEPKIWKATPTDASLYLKAFYDAKKEIITVKRSGTKLNTKYAYITV